MIKWFGEYLCDAGFLINLKERTDRFNIAEKELIDGGIEGVERFDAVVITEPDFIKYGCTQSHIEIAKKQIENNWEYVLYLEDDIKTEYYYSETIPSTSVDRKKVSTSIINDLSEYKPDVLWLGVRPEENTEYVSNNLVKTNKTLMSHAYLGSLKYAKFLIENLRYADNKHFSSRLPIDYFISQLTEKNCWQINSFENGENILKNDLKVYMSSPLIFNQGASFSNIIDRDVDYSIWVRGCIDAYVNIDKLKINPHLK
jgi:GR25 family glycosyltransferase involved in LPS biosynthesis